MLDEIIRLRRRQGLAISVPEEVMARFLLEATKRRFAKMKEYDGKDDRNIFRRLVTGWVAEWAELTTRGLGLAEMDFSVNTDSSKTNVPDLLAACKIPEGVKGFSADAPPLIKTPFRWAENFWLILREEAKYGPEWGPEFANILTAIRMGRLTPAQMEALKTKEGIKDPKAAESANKYALDVARSIPIWTPQGPPSSCWANDSKRQARLMTRVSRKFGLANYGSVEIAKSIEMDVKYASEDELLDLSRAVDDLCLRQWQQAYAASTTKLRTPSEIAAMEAASAKAYPKDSSHDAAKPPQVDPEGIPEDDMGGIEFSLPGEQVPS